MMQGQQCCLGTESCSSMFAAPYRRTNFMCSIAFSARLNEPGSIAWVLPLAANASNGSALPTPEEMLGAADASRFFLAGDTPTGSMQAAVASALQNATLTGLASDTAYTLVLSARDAAPLPNYIPEVMLLQLVAPDVRPPMFTGVLRLSVCSLRGPCREAVLCELVLLTCRKVLHSPTLLRSMHVTRSSR